MVESERDKTGESVRFLTTNQIFKEESIRQVGTITTISSVNCASINQNVAMNEWKSGLLRLSTIPLALQNPWCGTRNERFNTEDL